MFKIIQYSSCALLLSIMLFWPSIGHAQDPIVSFDNPKTSGTVTHIAQNGDNGDNDNDMDWGWIGAGLV